MKNVLVVGAGGFVGGFAVEEGLRRGYNVYAGVREGTSRHYLTDPRIRFVVLDFDKPETLVSALKSALPEGERYDYIIYNLGATKAVNFADFSRVNYTYLRNFTEALQEAGLVPEKLLYMSSLSVFGPCPARGDDPYTTAMVPQPNTRYGASKLKGEMQLAMSGIPYIIFRATGIYGPRDKDYYLVFKTLRKGWDPQVGFRRQDLSFLYVEDLARAMYDALEKAPTGKTYLLAEERTYTQGEFRRLSLQALGRRFAMPLRLPLLLTRAACFLSEKFGVARGKASTLNTDKYRILKQRNWRADTSEARRDFGFHTEVPLEEGVKRAVDWYRAEGWL